MIDWSDFPDGADRIMLTIMLRNTAHHILANPNANEATRAGALRILESISPDYLTITREIVNGNVFT
jgi:hypothetical protein